MRLDGFLEELGLTGVWREDHDDVGPGGGIGWSFYGEAVFFSASAGVASFRETNNDLNAGVAEIQGMRVSLRAVTDDRDLFGLHEGEIGVLVVIESCSHGVPFVGRVWRRVFRIFCEVRVALTLFLPAELFRRPDLPVFLLGDEEGRRRG